MSNEAKFTPGPWIMLDEVGVDDVQISTECRFDNSKIHICDVQGGYNGTIGVEQEANTHLIAAAPELYDALENLYELIYGTGVSRFDAEKYASRALNKARGES